MPAEKKPMRYGHTEGHTDVCFDESGSYIVTCGNDGDIRIWESLDDDDPKSINVGEKAYSVALKNGRLVTAVSNNTVQIHTFPDGAPDGILTRFTTNANHVVFNDSGTRVAAGSSDFMVKVVDVNDSSQQKTLRGHDAPVLSVAFDPKDIFLASASCDGFVRVWKIADQECVTSWPLLEKSNDVVNAKSICRLSWQSRSGKVLAVPVGKSVKLYSRDYWDNTFDLSDDSITQTLNVVSWSPCGRYLAAGSIDGNIVVWNVENKKCLERVKHEKSYTICGLAWHPRGGQIAYTDNEGNLGLLENVADLIEKASSGKVSATVAKDYDDLFDGDDEYEDGQSQENLRDLRAAMNTVVDEDDDDDDELMPSLSRPRHRGSFLDDDNSTDSVPLQPVGAGEEADEDQALGTKISSLAAPVKAVYDGPMPTPRQRPLQPGSTPAHLMHRFMVWNSIGIVRCYSDEEDNAIDVEFHDTSIHHAMHLTNTLNHTMCDLSQEAILLGCKSTDELASKLQCLHFSSWDANKEWIVDLPKGEDAEALCLGQGWAAVATSSLLVRIFMMGGAQREVFSLPGPVVSMAGHGDQLIIVYHRATGFDGEQCLGVQLMELGKKKKQVLHGDPLSLPKKSYLAWLGFSAEGTPCYADSEGIVQMMNRALGNTWTPVCNTREHCKGKSDHYWIVGIHENPQQLRCIPCKGARYPPTLPRPAVAILPFSLPYCQTATEKGQMEEQFWRSMLFQNHFDYLAASGYEYDENAKDQAVKEQQELLMKMFALSCKLEREFRCVELAELMTQNVVNLAIKYASRSKRLLLAQRLNELALEKAAEQAAAEEEEEKEDFRARLNAGRTDTEWNQSYHHHRPTTAQHTDDTEDNEEQEDMDTEDIASERTNRLNSVSPCQTSPEKKTPKAATIVPSNQGRSNPFKVSSNSKGPGSTSGQARCANILDNMTKSVKKPAMSSNQPANKQTSPVLKPLMPKPKSKQAQTTLFQTGTVKSNSTSAEQKESKVELVAAEQTAPPPATPENTETKRPKTGFQLWLEENRADIIANDPDLEEGDIIKEGMSRFRSLLPEERMVWTEKAKGGSTNAVAGDTKKRKHMEDENKETPENKKNRSDDTSSTKKQKPLDHSTNLKLSSFAFKKD
ncbi:WD repeat and HMG-box DNA-binding protein 1 isoform X2 [Protopterus annectens]|uniref:WD repeat and HMG-box DNA-binding protein 1 isoform X2 n=1 Tax=Protopterus annectens TaxID=7888 RepID=UPI001CFA7E37|nr:WD repeat and HMG-box DNA-binding protein 1 isoform X2 [Protopterus annectens]